MPLVRFDMIEGRTEAEITAILDASHEAVLKALNAPQRDRFQVVHQHKPYELIIQDTGLGIDRSDKVILITVVSVYRDDQTKQKWYQAFANELHAKCGIDPADIMISLVSNTLADWSFGHGQAQFLTGELGRR